VRYQSSNGDDAPLYTHIRCPTWPVVSGTERNIQRTGSSPELKIPEPYREPILRAKQNPRLAIRYKSQETLHPLLGLPLLRQRKSELKERAVSHRGSSDQPH